MRLLIKKSGKLISKYEIMKHLHDDIFNQNNNTVEVLIGRLRKKSHLINVPELKIKEVMDIIWMQKFY